MKDLNLKGKLYQKNGRKKKGAAQATPVFEILPIGN